MRSLRVVFDNFKTKRVFASQNGEKIRRDFVVWNSIGEPYRRTKGKKRLGIWYTEIYFRKRSDAESR